MSVQQETIRRQAEPDQTRSAQTTPTAPSRLIGTAELRDKVTDLHEQVTDLHEDVQSSTLHARASQLAQSDPADLLATLRGEWGLSWESLAHMLGVSSAAIRKWRRGASISTENQHHLARVIAFCEMLHDADPRIGDPAQWLEEPFVSSATVRACDLYAAGLLSPLLSVAAGRTSREALLDQFDPGWRENYGADDGWSVERGGDGAPLIVKRR
jgi:DNA-binding transcriptional regulator YiaG